MHGGHRCPVCGEAVGVYERTVAYDADGQRLTSVAREPELAAAADAHHAATTLVHEGCAPSYHPHAHD